MKLRIEETARRVGEFSDLREEPAGEPVPAPSSEEASPSGRWEGVIAREGEMTGDGRMIEDGALRWDDLPIPLRVAFKDVGGHDGAEAVSYTHLGADQRGAQVAAERRPP